MTKSQLMKPRSSTRPGAKRALVVALALPALFAAANLSAKTLVYCSEGSPENFYPGVNTTGTSFDANSQIYSRLVDFERGTTNVVPGLAEKMRSETSRGFPAAYLSRQVVGVRRKTLVVALPGSPKGAADCLASILGLLPHALSLIQGNRPEHPAAP